MSTTSTSTTNTTTQREPFEPVSDESRAVARAILSTLSPGAAACVLVALAGLARAIVDAFDIMREGGPMAEGLARQTLGAAVDAFDALSDGQRDAGVAAFAVSAAWWFSTPAEVCASFWRNEHARASVTSQSRGAAVEAAALRVMLASGALTSAPAVVRLPLPAGVERVQHRGVMYVSDRDPIAREPLRAILRDVARKVSERGDLEGANAELAVVLAGVNAGDGVLADLVALASMLCDQCSDVHESRTRERNELPADDTFDNFERADIAARLIAYVKASVRDTPRGDLAKIELEAV